MSFPKVYDDCLVDLVPNNELPLSCREDDNCSDLVSRSLFPNEPPNRVSYVQEEEIFTHVNELLKKGMVCPSSSPF